MKLLDVYGNTYTYGQLGTIAKTYPSPKRRRAKRSEIRRELRLDTGPEGRRLGDQGAGLRKRTARAVKMRRRPPGKQRAVARRKTAAAPAKERLSPIPRAPTPASTAAPSSSARPRHASRRRLRAAPIGFDKQRLRDQALRQGARVIGGTVLGRIGKPKPVKAPHLLFEIRPAGRGAPRVDPKPILDGWKLLESTAIYRAAKKNPFVGEDAKTPIDRPDPADEQGDADPAGRLNPRIAVYGCGEADIRSGQIDRRVLATLEYLASSGLKPTVTSLRCGHGYLTASGNVSEHSTGTAVDIAAVNGVPIVGHQGSGSITDITIQRLLTLQGTMKPHQIISLMTYDGTDNTFAMGDHADHIHVGWRPLYGQSTKAARRIDAILKPKQWIKLIDRLGEIDNPEVREAPSRFSLKVTENASPAHQGE